MYWLFPIMSFISMIVAVRTTSAPLMVFMFLAAFVFLIIWAVSWFKAKLGNNKNDQNYVLNSVEMYRMRQQIEARKATQQTSTDDPAKPRDDH